MKDYDPNNKTLLSNWFDPHNLVHMKAWNALRMVGMWPMWFQDLMQEEGISIDHYWEMQIKSRICEAWTEYMVKN